MKITSFFSFILFLFFSNGLKSQNISIDTNYSADQLVKDIFFGNQSSSCITVENVIIKGMDFGGGDKSFGYFNRNGSNFEMEKGIILSTGSALSAIGPNNNIQSSGTSSWSGDQDLENALNIQKTFNATILEFDFTANNTNKISFDYLFASEQYLLNGTAAQCGYTDGFAFLIKKSNSTDSYRNLAVIPGTNIPIKSNTVRGSGGLCEPINEQYFGQYNPVMSPTNFNGQTKTFSAISDIIPGVKYHLKLVIADQGNELYDSGVFLKAGSFVGNKDLGNDRLLETGNSLCENSTLTLNATTSGATYQWYKDGIPIPGEIFSTFTVSQPGFYEVIIDDSSCLLKGSIRIEYAEKPLVLEKEFCNYNNGDPILVNLQQLNSKIISNYKDYFVVKYYQDSQHQILLPDEFSYLNDTTIFVQVESGNCTKIDQIVHLYSPKKSTLLKDQIICPNATAKLEAEPGFKYYKWLKENGEVIAEGATIYFVDQIPIGKYSVELTSMNGCSLIQNVTVLAAELPIITRIEVNGNTATVFVTGGNPPYEYALDQGNYQSSNIFTNIPRGLHKIYVKDASNCEIVEKEFLVINLINVITPNSDGINDILDYSDLKIKKEVSFIIYDRFGTQVFQSKNNEFIWNGKLNGRPLPTGNYWYVLNWIEPDTNLPVFYQGWILVKNRN